MSPEMQLPAWWRAILILMILMCAAIIVFPSLERSPAFELMGLVLFPTWFVSMIVIERRRGRANQSIGEIYAQARQGRRFRMHPLEMSALVALILTSVGKALH